MVAATVSRLSASSVPKPSSRKMASSRAAAAAASAAEVVGQGEGEGQRRLERLAAGQPAHRPAFVGVGMVDDGEIAAAVDRRASTGRRRAARRVTEAPPTSTVEGLADQPALEAGGRQVPGQLAGDGMASPDARRSRRRGGLPRPRPGRLEGAIALGGLLLGPARRPHGSAVAGTGTSSARRPRRQGVGQPAAGGRRRVGGGGRGGGRGDNAAGRCAPPTSRAPATPPRGRRTAVAGRRRDRTRAGRGRRRRPGAEPLVEPRRPAGGGHGVVGDGHRGRRSAAASAAAAAGLGEGAISASGSGSVGHRSRARCRAASPRPSSVAASAASALRPPPWRPLGGPVGGHERRLGRPSRRRRMRRARW